MTKKVSYTPSALKGNVLALGGNLWNEKVGHAIRNQDGKKSELTLAAEVFFNEILPELHNFVEQQQARKPERVIGCCFAGVASACPRHERKGQRI